MKWKYNTTVLLITCLLFVFLLQRCDETVKYRIHADWSFTVLKKHRPKRECALPVSKGKTMVLVYYPEICGYCLNQIDMIMESISNIEMTKRNKNITIECIIATQDTITMQYYLDEKMENINTIYIDNKGNFKKVFFDKKDAFEYPAYFVLEGNKVSIKKKLNDKNNIIKLLSLFSRTLE